MIWVRKIWNDPVFSSLIAASFIFLLTFLFDKYSSTNFLEKSPNWEWAISHNIVHGTDCICNI
jgi:hypothetical protein